VYRDEIRLVDQKSESINKNDDAGSALVRVD